MIFVLARVVLSDWQENYRPAFRFGPLRVGGRALLQPGLHCGCRDTQQLGGEVHRQAADMEQNCSGLHRRRLAASGRVGEVQAAGFSQVTLLGAHQPIPDMLLAPTAFAPQPHDPPPAEFARLGR